jgi:heptosyltransferase-2
MKILIIKLGAMGDVLRTTPLLTALKKKYPQGHIVWLVDSKCAEVLWGNPLIDALLVYSQMTLDHLKSQAFDLAVNLDKDKEALDAITLAKADKKIGFGRGPKEELCALNPESEYAWRLGVDDELKFRTNQKTYQEISFEQLGLDFKKEEYLFDPGPRHRLEAAEHLEKLGVPLKNRLGPIIGLNTGSGNRFAGKKLPVSTWARLADRFYKELGATVLLLGGEDEIERNQWIKDLCRFSVVNTGSHPIQRFAAIVETCDLVISGDTTAMHIAIAAKTPVVAYFASTCAQEIELYGRGKKIVSSIDCAPCYLKKCPIQEKCMREMDPNLIFDAAVDLLEKPKTTPPPLAPPCQGGEMIVPPLGKGRSGGVGSKT